MPYVDRTGVAAHPGGPEGLVVHLDGALLEFDDERDAIAMARAILLRLGEENRTRGVTV